MEEELFDDINSSDKVQAPEVQAEVVEEKNNLPANIEKGKPEKKGRMSLRYKTIANYAARGYSIEIIAKAVNMTPNTVYRIIENNEMVWEEMNRILKSIFSEGDRILANLYLKALYKLDARLSHPSTEEDAIKKIMETFGKRTGGSGDKPAVIQQFFQGGQGGTGTPLVEGSIDDIIIKKRKERGLTIPTIEKPPTRGDDDDEGEEY